MSSGTSAGEGPCLPQPRPVPNPPGPQSDACCAWSNWATKAKCHNAHSPCPGEPRVEASPGTKCRQQHPCSSPRLTTAPGGSRKGRREAKPRTMPRRQQQPVLRTSAGRGLPAGPEHPSSPNPGGPADRRRSQLTGGEKEASAPGRRPWRLGKGATRPPGTAGGQYLVISTINCHNVFSRWSAAPYTCTVSHPSVGHLAHKIDLGEIIQFHFTFSCLGTVPAATCVLPEVRKRWTRQSPAVVNGTPYPLYEFPVNLQITSNTIALHSDSVLCLHVYLLPIADDGLGCRQRSLGAALGACMRGSVGGRGQRAPAAFDGSKPARTNHSHVPLLFLQEHMTTIIAPVGLCLPFSQPPATPCCPSPVTSILSSVPHI